MNIVNIAGYRFTGLTNITDWSQQLKSFCEQHLIRGTITLSAEGINLNLAGTLENIDAFTAYLCGFPEFSEMEFKRSYSETIPFRRLRVKLRNELIPVNQPGITFSFEPKYVTPTTLRDWIAEGKVTLIDTRNEFEYQIGTFDGAIDLHLTNFRDFPDFNE